MRCSPRARSHFAPNGIAFVSYNAYPGGYLRRLLREAAMWFAGDDAAGAAQAEQARELFRVLECGPSEDPYGGMLEMEVPALATARRPGSCTTSCPTSGSPSGSATSRAAAASHGLGYVGESSPLDLWPPNYPRVETQARRVRG